MLRIAVILKRNHDNAGTTLHPSPWLISAGYTDDMIRYLDVGADLLELE